MGGKQLAGSWRAALVAWTLDCCVISVMPGEVRWSLSWGLKGKIVWLSEGLELEMSRPYTEETEKTATASGFREVIVDSRGPATRSLCVHLPGMLMASVPKASMGWNGCVFSSSVYGVLAWLKLPESQFPQLQPALSHSDCENSWYQQIQMCF